MANRSRHPDTSQRAAAGTPPVPALRADPDGRAADEEAIDAVLRGEVERYAELVDRYQAAAWKLAYSAVGNFDDARELSQNGFVKAYQQLGRFRRDAKFSTWLYRIVMNECLDFLRRRARHPTVALEAPGDDGRMIRFEVEDPAAGPGEQAMNRELARTLGAAIQLLPGQQRTAFVLHHLQGLEIAEAAGVTGCRPGTVKSHVFRACEQLRRLVTAWDGHGGETHDA